MREEDRLLALQRCLASVALEPDGASFAADPAGLARAAGLPGKDQAAFRRNRDRLGFYREGVQDLLWDPITRYFPLTLALLEKGEAAGTCRSAFLASRSLVSPFYRDIAATFLGWLDASGWGRPQWPFLLELAHFELVKELVEHFPDEDPPPETHPRPSSGDRLVLAPPTQVLAYTHRVFEATWERPAPEPGACSLLAFRGPDGYIRVLAITDATAALLVRGQGEPIAAVLAALGFRDEPGALAFLEDLREQGALLGFRNAEAPGIPSRPA
jgi:hypothetical protein